jgi:hypothetical protein
MEPRLHTWNRATGDKIETEEILGNRFDAHPALLFHDTFSFGLCHDPCRLGGIEAATLSSAHALHGMYGV